MAGFAKNLKPGSIAKHALDEAVPRATGVGVAASGGWPHGNDVIHLQVFLAELAKAHFAKPP